MDNCLSQYLNGLDENFLIVMYSFLKLCTIGHMLGYKRQWENQGNTSGTIDVGSWWGLSEAKQELAISSEISLPWDLHLAAFLAQQQKYLSAGAPTLSGSSETAHE